MQGFCLYAFIMEGELERAPQEAPVYGPFRLGFCQGPSSLGTSVPGGSWLLISGVRSTPNTNVSGDIFPIEGRNRILHLRIFVCFCGLSPLPLTQFVATHEPPELGSDVSARSRGHHWASRMWRSMHRPWCRLTVAVPQWRL